MHCFFLASWCRVQLEMLIVAHLVKNFSTFYGSKRYITIYTMPCQWCIFRCSSVNLTLPFYLFKIHFNIILKIVSRFSERSLSFSFSTTSMYAFFFLTVSAIYFPVSIRDIFIHQHSTARGGSWLPQWSTAIAPCSGFSSSNFSLSPCQVISHVVQPPECGASDFSCSLLVCRVESS